MNNKLNLIIGLIVYLLSSYLAYSYFSGSKEEIKNPLGNYKAPVGEGQESIDNDPKTEECPINGEMLTKKQRDSWKKRRPLGIMVENSVEARPQSGLSSADTIFEAVAEGGITRFLTIFYCKDTSFVGPVRSARIYFVRLLQQYGENPLYAHVGGANCDEETGSGCSNGAKADALGIINKMGWGGYNDLNQFSVPFPNFWRDPERLPNRATEHTVYTSTKKLWSYAKDKRKLSNIDEKNISWDKNFTEWKFKEDAPLSDRGNIQKINFGFWTFFADQYKVAWIYDKQTNSFKRENGGQPHVDKNNNKQLQAKNIMIAFMNESPANDGYEGGHILYNTIGEGKALVFQDGKAIEGKWMRKKETDRLRFYNKQNEEVSIVRGMVFVEILPSTNKVDYQ